MSERKLWLWKNGDHYWAFEHEYPCESIHGDPCTLGEPCGWALLKPSVDRSTPHPLYVRLWHYAQRKWQGDKWGLNKASD